MRIIRKPARPFPAFESSAPLASHLPVIKLTPRVVFTFAAVLGVAAAFWFKKDVVDVTANLNDFSYWGTVATLVALLLALAELVHSIRITRSLQEQTASAIAAIRRVEDAAAISDCIAAIDITIHEVLAERYEGALGSFHHFRKLCVRVIPGFGPASSSSAADTVGLGVLGTLELKLASATRSSTSAPFSKAQKHDILKRLQVIKQAVERYNPANRT